MKKILQLVGLKRSYNDFQKTHLFIYIRSLKFLHDELEHYPYKIYIFLDPNYRFLNDKVNYL